MKLQARQYLQAIADDRFVRLFNLESKLRAFALRMSAADGGLQLTDGEQSIAVASKARVWRYRAGIRKYLDRLAAVYGLDKLPIEMGHRVVDCGANIGELGLWVRLARPGVSYVGFEPSPREFRALQKNAAGMQTHSMALWNENTSKIFHLATDTADSSLIENPHTSEAVEVRCARLDDVLPTGPVRVLKVEAEGAEPEVLEGAVRTLENTDYVVVDSGPERGYSEEETTPAVVNFLLRNGFQLVSISHRRVICVFRSERLAAGG